MSGTAGLHRLRRFCYKFARDGSRRAMSGSSKVVSSEVMDMELPELTFHFMCWSRVETGGQRTALVSTVQTVHYSTVRFQPLTSLSAG